MWFARLLLWAIVRLAVFPELAESVRFRIASRRGKRQSDRLSIRVLRRSGREGDHLVDNAPTINSRLDALVKEIPATRVNWILFVIRKPVTWVIARQLRNAARRGLRGSFFRSRSFKRGEKPRDSDDIYWREEAWRNYVSSGGWEPDRYDESGKRVLYLSTTALTASRESREGDSTGCTVFIQKFELNLTNTLSVVLDHRLETRFPYLHHLLLNSEYLPGESHLPDPLPGYSPPRLPLCLSWDRCH